MRGRRGRGRGEKPSGSRRTKIAPLCRAGLGGAFVFSFSPPLPHRCQVVKSLLITGLGFFRLCPPISLKTPVALVAAETASRGRGRGRGARVSVCLSVCLWRLSGTGRSRNPRPPPPPARQPASQPASLRSSAGLSSLDGC